MADENPVISTRNLVDYDVGPCRRLTGILEGITTEKQTYGQGDTARESTRATINLKEIEVIETIEPYGFPIFTFQVTLSNRKKSRWGFFSEAFNAIVDGQYSPEQLDPSNAAYVKPSDRPDIESCYGKRFGIVLADGEDGRPTPPMLWDGRTEKDVPTPAWTVYEVEGFGVVGGAGVNPSELAESLLDGKTLPQFSQAALANPVIRNDAGLIQAIGMPQTAPGNFANALVNSGKFTKDAAGVYHKVVGATPPVAEQAAG